MGALLLNQPLTAGLFRLSLMLTLGLSAIGIEMVWAGWGRTEFTMPKPALFNGTREACPAASFGDWFSHNCSTIFILDGRVRVYNEIFIPIVGLVLLVLFLPYGIVGTWRLKSSEIKQGWERLSGLFKAD